MTLWNLIVTEKLEDWAPINAATKEDIPHVDSSVAYKKWWLLTNIAAPQYP